MPELPEVETIRLALLCKIIGKQISHVDIRVPKQWIGNHQLCIGQRVQTIGRRGKVLNIFLSNGVVINIHLKLTGQILYSDHEDQAVFDRLIPYSKTDTMPGTTTRIIIVFSDKSALFFNDLRKFGWIKVTSKPEGPAAVDVLSTEFTASVLHKIIRTSKQPIKVFLMDQQKIAGIGNIYANDALFTARIHPLRKADTLTNEEIQRLHNGITEVIGQGLKYKGSSARDEIYVLPDGSAGSYQKHFKVYHREHAPCLRCKTPIKRIKQAGRSSFFCPRCQTL